MPKLLHFVEEIRDQCDQILSNYPRPSSAEGWHQSDARLIVSTFTQYLNTGVAVVPTDMRVAQDCYQRYVEVKTHKRHQGHRRRDDLTFTLL